MLWLAQNANSKGQPSAIFFKKIKYKMEIECTICISVCPIEGKIGLDIEIFHKCRVHFVGLIYVGNKNCKTVNS